MRARFEQSRGVWILILVTAAVHLLDVATGRSILAIGAMSARIWAGEIHRLILATFLHGGLTHLGFNLYALYVFGQVTERTLGTRRFVALYLISGVTGYIASLLLAPGLPAVGASAAIFGLMGFTIHFRLRRLPLRWSQIDSAFLQIFLLNLLVAQMVPNIDHWAHLGGFIGGVLCGSLLGLDPPWSPRRGTGRRETAAAAVLLAVLLFGGLRPLDVAQVVRRFAPELGQTIEKRYEGFFLPYLVTSPAIYWNYMDTAGPWQWVGDELPNAASNRPVALALFWRWDPGVKAQDNVPLTYEVVWRRAGDIVSTNTGEVHSADPNNGQIYLRSVTPVLSGTSLVGAWEVSMTVQGINSVRLQLNVRQGR